MGSIYRIVELCPIGSPSKNSQKPELNPDLRGGLEISVWDFSQRPDGSQNKLPQANLTMILLIGSSNHHMKSKYFYTLKLWLNIGIEWQNQFT
ncbi:hypothetical protein CR513_07126, partial [Mucuna pruriens]